MQGTLKRVTMATAAAIAMTGVAAAQEPNNEAPLERLYNEWAGEDRELTVSEWDTAVDQRFGEQDVNLDASKWDNDGNGVISHEEFEQAANQTNLLELFQTGGANGAQGAREGSDPRWREVYDEWAGEDGKLTVDEWDAAADEYYGEQEVNLDVTNWDDDGNGVISWREFQEAATQTGVALPTELGL